MQWNELHATIFKEAFGQAAGYAELGAVVFARCLTPDIVRALAADEAFVPEGWQVYRVAQFEDVALRTITADQAVEIREAKKKAVLLLVDTDEAGAGMDGIYSASREIDEPALFDQALRIARNTVTKNLSRDERLYAEQAVVRGRRGRRYSISKWTEFDYLVQIAHTRRNPGNFLYLLGLWPILDLEGSNYHDGLNQSRLFVDRFLGIASSSTSPRQRIDSMRFINLSDEQQLDLERFLRNAATKPLLPALENLAEVPHIWVNALVIEGATQEIQDIDLVPWRTRTMAVARWSGLEAGRDENAPPELILDPDADLTGNYSKLEVRWKARPDNLEKDAVQYHVAVMTAMDEELASRDVSHSTKREEKCRFTNDDFSELEEDALISAKVIVSVIGNDSIQQESEEIQIRFGEPTDQTRQGAGKVVRTFSEGLIELADRESEQEVAAALITMPVDSKGYLMLRTRYGGKSYRVYQPPLIAEVENQWQGDIGRWRVKVRTSGSRAGAVEFVPIRPSDGMISTKQGELHQRVERISRRLADHYKKTGGGVGQIYDQQTKVFETIIREYILAWAALLESSDPEYALANTVEVQTLSGRTIGLIVLPSHPVRVAWHVGYDNLAFHAAFEQGQSPRNTVDELQNLDGAMFPAFLPGLNESGTFVFTDTLGFHAVGMVPDTDREPKAAIAKLARALGEGQVTEAVPTVGEQSAQILGDEIVKYVDSHDRPRLLHIHALRPGDGLTIARSLGQVHRHYSEDDVEDSLEQPEQTQSPAFVLELYPSEQQKGVAGRFIGETRERRRSGAGAVETKDRWMLESMSLPGGVNLPRLRWARKEVENPSSAAHLAVAFDTFESRTIAESTAAGDGVNGNQPETRPFYAFGLLTFLEREYASKPSPEWRSALMLSDSGERHPADRAHTDRLQRIQQVLQRCVARSIENGKDRCILKTEISPEKAHNLGELHRLCDWVVTLDRNAGIEYFDSPHDDPAIYDAYVIDCVPEREDLGCLQLITSTSNDEEVRNLLDDALSQMGLSHSRRNAEHLMGNLKALSGRLAIRLTGQRAPTSELIALALAHAGSRDPSEDDDCWLSLKRGFFVPVDDIQDLLPPFSAADRKTHANRARPDLIYVTSIPRKGLAFQFVEVKYRRHLRTARNHDLLQSISSQTESLRERWDNWYSHEEVSSSFRAIRRAKLARVLRFYADKAYRHHLPRERYAEISAEIDRMLARGGSYAFAQIPRPDRGWVFCPEYDGVIAEEISPETWGTRVFIFGPSILPDVMTGDATMDVNSLTNIDSDEAVVTPKTAGIEEAGGSDETGSVLPSELIAKRSQVERQADAVSIVRADDMQASEGVDGSSALNPSAAVSDADEDDGRLVQPTPSVLIGSSILTGADVRWKLSVKGNPHLLMAGLPGMGKTTSLINMCMQMLDQGVRPILFSYHQDIDEKLLELGLSLRYVDFQGLGFNPLQVLNRETPMAYLDVAGAMRDIFTAIFPELGDIQGESIRTAIKDSFVEKGWGDPSVDRTSLAEPDFGRFVDILRADAKPDSGRRSLLARLNELSDYGFFSTTDFMGSLWESEDPVLVRIHKTSNDVLQRAFASLIFYGLYKDMFRRGISDRITHALIFDEAHRASKLSLIPTMAKECRKYGISLVLASQEARDFNVSLFSAIANYLVLRMTEADAKALVRNVSSSDQERTLTDRIKQMERFRALYFTEGQKKPARVSLLPPMV